jgi:hypothetical protein
MRNVNLLLKKEKHTNAMNSKRGCSKALLVTRKQVFVDHTRALKKKLSRFK